MQTKLDRTIRPFGAHIVGNERSLSHRAALVRGIFSVAQIMMAFAVVGAESAVTDTFALCQLVGTEREQALVVAAGAVRECQLADGQALSMKVFLPATGTAEWKLFDGVTAKRLDDRLTAELRSPGLKAPLTLALDAWHVLVLARGGVYWDGTALGALPAANAYRLGGGAEFYCTQGRTVTLKSARELTLFIQGLPPAFRSWTVPAEKRRIVKGQSVKFDHGLSPTNTTAYTLVVDVKFPQTSWNQWRSIYTTALTLDGAAFVDPKNRFGIAGKYLDLAIRPESRHRVTVAYDGRGAAAFYWDGKRAVAVGCERAGLRHPSIWLGGDDNGEDGEIEIEQVLLFDQALEAHAVELLGGVK